MIDGPDGIIEKARKIHAETIPAYLAAKSAKPEDGLAKPILGALLPTEILIGSSIERSMSTSMGWRLDTIFTRIAKDNYDYSFGGKEKYVEVSGFLSDITVTTIQGIMSQLTDRVARERPSAAREYELIRHTVGAGGGGKNRVAVRCDVFFLDQVSGIEWCLESKTIKPNKGQLESAKTDALKLVALKASGVATYKNSRGETIPTGTEIRPVLGTYYDAWGPLVDGNFPTIDTFFERSTQFLSGRETWALVGKDSATYDEFMSLMWEIHCERREELGRAFLGE